MYAWPTRFRTTTTRETLTLTLRMRDRDTDEFINISGITGVPQTITHWVVRAGANVITDTLSSIVVPQFPYSNSMLALTFVVPPGLAITAGSALSLTSLDGLNTLVGYVTSYNATSGVVVAQIGLSFQFEIRAKFSSRDLFDGYTTFPNAGIGTVGFPAPLITASLDDGKIKFVENTILQIEIPESDMRKLWLDTFDCAMTMNDTQVQRQVFVGDLPVVGGGVTL